MTATATKKGENKTAAAAPVTRAQLLEARKALQAMPRHGPRVGLQAIPKVGTSSDAMQERSTWDLLPKIRIGESVFYRRPSAGDECLAVVEGRNGKDFNLKIIPDGAIPKKISGVRYYDPQDELKYEIDRVKKIMAKAKEDKNTELANEAAAEIEAMERKLAERLKENDPAAAFGQWGVFRRTEDGHIVDRLVRFMDQLEVG